MSQSYKLNGLCRLKENERRVRSLLAVAKLAHQPQEQASQSSNGAGHASSYHAQPVQQAEPSTHEQPWPVAEQGWHVQDHGDQLD